MEEGVEGEEDGLEPFDPEDVGEQMSPAGGTSSHNYTQMLDKVLGGTQKSGLSGSKDLAGSPEATLAVTADLRPEPADSAERDGAPHGADEQPQDDGGQPLGDTYASDFAPLGDTYKSDFGAPSDEEEGEQAADVTQSVADVTQSVADAASDLATGEAANAIGADVNTIAQVADNEEDKRADGAADTPVAGAPPVPAASKNAEAAADGAQDVDVSHKEVAGTFVDATVEVAAATSTAVEAAGDDDVVANTELSPAGVDGVVNVDPLPTADGVAARLEAPPTEVDGIAKAEPLPIGEEAAAKAGAPPTGGDGAAKAQLGVQLRALVAGASASDIQAFLKGLPFALCAKVHVAAQCPQQSEKLVDVLTQLMADVSVSEVQAFLKNLPVAQSAKVSEAIRVVQQSERSGDLMQLVVDASVSDMQDFLSDLPLEDRAKVSESMRGPQAEPVVAETPKGEEVVFMKKLGGGGKGAVHMLPDEDVVSMKKLPATAQGEELMPSQACADGPPASEIQAGAPAMALTETEAMDVEKVAANAEEVPLVATDEVPGQVGKHLPPDAKAALDVSYTMYKPGACAGGGAAGASGLKVGGGAVGGLEALLHGQRHGVDPGLPSVASQAPAPPVPSQGTPVPPGGKLQPLRPGPKARLKKSKAAKSPHVESWDSRHHLGGSENELKPKRLRDYFSTPQLPRGVVEHPASWCVRARSQQLPNSADGEPPLCPRHHLNGKMVDRDGERRLWNDRWSQGVHVLNDGMHPLHRSYFSQRSLFETAPSQRWRRHQEYESAPGVWLSSQQRRPPRFGPVGA